MVKKQVIRFLNNIVVPQIDNFVKICNTKDLIPDVDIEGVRAAFAYSKESFNAILGNDTDFNLQYGFTVKQIKTRFEKPELDPVNTQFALAVSVPFSGQIQSESHIAPRDTDCSKFIAEIAQETCENIDTAVEASTNYMVKSDAVFYWNNLCNNPKLMPLNTINKHAHEPRVIFLLTFLVKDFEG